MKGLVPLQEETVAIRSKRLPVDITGNRTWRSLPWTSLLSIYILKAVSNLRSYGCSPWLTCRRHRVNLG